MQGKGNKANQQNTHFRRSEPLENITFVSEKSLEMKKSSVSVSAKSVPEPFADSVAVYDWFWMCWRIVGIDTGYNRYLCGFYDIMLNVFVTIAYPLHLTIGLFSNPSLADVFKNLAINVTCIACSIKHYILRYKLKDIQTMQEKLSHLDRSAAEKDEREFFNRVPRIQALRVTQLFFATYAGANVSAAAAALLSSERRLMYPAWFPFDYSTSALYYWLTLGYQFYGITMQIVQNLANDIYAPMSLCVVGGHVRLLGMRVGKIGYDSKKSLDEHREDLISCIRDHKTLVDILKLLQGTVFYGQLVQFLSSGLIICVTLVYLLFYADSFFAYVYYAVYLFAMLIEIFPCCYYGTLLELELEGLPYAIFNSNWLIETPQYQKDMIMFMQLTLKDIRLLAGGFIGINLNAFFGTCKMAYSLFAVVLSTK